MAGAMAPSISRTIAREGVIAAVGAINAPSIAAPSTQAICLSLTKIPTGYCMSHRSTGPSVVTTKPQAAYSSPALGSNRYRRSPLIFGPAQEVALEAQHRPIEKKHDTQHHHDVGKHCRTLASRSASPPFRRHPPSL